MSTNGPVPLSRWEIVGAWLHIWTPPRDSRVPPIPWRKAAIAGLVLAAGVAVFVAFAVPAIDSGKKEGAAKAQREQAAVTAAERARLIREGRVHRGRAERPADLNARNAPAQIAARRGLVLSLQDAVQADALARVRAGSLRGPIAATTCRPYPPPRRGRRRRPTLRSTSWRTSASPGARRTFRSATTSWPSRTSTASRTRGARSHRASVRAAGRWPSSRCPRRARRPGRRPRADPT